MFSSELQNWIEWSVHTKCTKCSISISITMRTNHTEHIYSININTDQVFTANEIDLSLANIKFINNSHWDCRYSSVYGDRAERVKRRKKTDNKFSGLLTIFIAILYILLHFRWCRHRRWNHYGESVVPASRPPPIW